MSETEITDLRRSVDELNHNMVILNKNMEDLVKAANSIQQALWRISQYGILMK